MRLTHFKDRLYGHYKEHARFFRELARTMDEDPELSYKEYTDLKAQLLLEKRQEEECKQRVEHREGNVLAALHSDPNVNKLTVEVLKESIRKIKASSTSQYAALRVGGNRPHLLDQVEAVHMRPRIGHLYTSHDVDHMQRCPMLWCCLLHCYVGVG